MTKIFLKLKIRNYNAEHNVVFIPRLFDYKSANFGRFNIAFDYNYDLNNFHIEFESTNYFKKKLSSIALAFFSYLKVIIGYYPQIIDCSFMELKYLPEKYKTKINYIRNDGQYITTIDCETFIKSFNYFRVLYDKCLLQLSVFDCSIMECTHYSDISIVNVLQALDGIFDNLSITKSVKEIVDEKTKKKIIKKVLKFDEIETIINAKEKYKNLPEAKRKEKIVKLMSNFNDNLIRVNKLNFKDKLDFLFNCTIVDVFVFEKQLNTDNRYYYNNLLNLFKNTRNMIAHCSSDVKFTLNGCENVGYINKLLLVFRLLIFKELNLEEKLDVDKLNRDIKSMNNYLKDKIFNKE